MNAVEIEEDISELDEQPFDAAEFLYAFLQAFGNINPFSAQREPDHKQDQSL